MPFVFYMKFETAHRTQKMHIKQNARLFNIYEFYLKCVSSIACI